MPATMRLRMGKFSGEGCVRVGNSLMIAPPDCKTFRRVFCFFWVADVDAGTENADRQAAGGERALMADGVDTACQSADDD